VNGGILSLIKDSSDWNVSVGVPLGTEPSRVIESPVVYASPPETYWL
jgi:hypothetical protein